MGAHKPTGPAGPTALAHETLQRQHAALKRAYSKLQVVHWEKEQVIEQRDGEIVRLKAALAAAKKGTPDAAPAAKESRVDAGSSSLLLAPDDDDDAVASASAGPAPVQTPPASDASEEAASPPQVPEKKKRTRGTGFKRVRPERAPWHDNQGCDEPGESEATKFRGIAFFEHFGVHSYRTLQAKLAEFLIARDPNTNTEEKRRTATNQAKYKADNFMMLLWLDPPGTPQPYSPGNVDEFFGFFVEKLDHDDMGREDSHAFVNHAHRVAHWIWPSHVKDHKSFLLVDNRYVARRARGFMTGVRAMHGLYEIWKGKAGWPDVARNPVGLVTAPFKAPKEHDPCTKRPVAPRKRARKAAVAHDDDKSNSGDDATNTASSGGDSTDEEDWSCADDDSYCGGGGGGGGSSSTSRARKAGNKTSDTERALARLFKSIGQRGS